MREIGPIGVNLSCSRVRGREDVHKKCQRRDASNLAEEEGELRELLKQYLELECSARYPGLAGEKAALGDRCQAGRCERTGRRDGDKLGRTICSQ